MSGLNKEIAPMMADELKRYMPDLVEVVRCRDCRWYEIYQLKQDGTDDRRYNPSYCTLFRHRFKPNWYCADGERREDDTD